MALTAAVPAQERPVNRLADATSPYLRQHRHNPVDWYPWGAEALERAKREEKPIFLSIGYAACHWCHVMERESFEDPEIAKVLNERFVNVKVDREERPDLDEIYMTALQGMTGGGGWPMSMFLTPDLRPFFGGTYFPIEDARGQPSFRRVLDHVHGLWTTKRDVVLDHSEKVARFLRDSLAPAGDPEELAVEDLVGTVAASAKHFDAERGGFAPGPRFAPKFPHAAELRNLLEEHARTGDADALRMAEQTLVAMAHGGLYDQLGGGFHRYSTDREWAVPHFEKMLYDNALLAQAYADAFLVSGNRLFERIATETLDAMCRDLRDPEGGFWSTIDADSEGVEGRYYVWTREQIDAALGDDAEAVALRFGVRPGGNWEGVSVLRAALSVEDVASQLGASVDEVQAQLSRGRAELLALRGERVAPATDDKIVAAWNGMAIAALADGYRVFGNERWLDAARDAARFVLGEMRDADTGRLYRTSWRGSVQVAAYLEDYACVADGLFRLFECDGDPTWLAAGRDLLGILARHFSDDVGGSFFFTPDDHEELLTRANSVQESATPTGVAMAAQVFLRGSLLLGDTSLWDRGIRAVRAHRKEFAAYPTACPSLGLAIRLALADPREVVVVGEPLDPRTVALRRKVQRSYPPHHGLVLVHDANREALEKLSVLVEGKTAEDGVPAAYVCRHGACEAPVTDPDALVLGRAQAAK
ncbi:MAG: thioredoxin domain-containing protein [Planctomycetota bacterium]|nr:thioredoxin domain-containing protein [Planctomycetota bacterium]MDA1222060.1 thioredoxin domain-containing protein [Planctomycetota bacterium]